MSIQGPHIAFAFMCEKVLQEQDGVLSAIRIVERLNLNQPPEAQPEKTSPKLGVMPIAGINILIGLKSGDYKGTGKLAVKAYAPNGKEMPGLKIEVDMELKGGHQGSNIIINAGIPFTEDGVYWLDIIFDDRVLTRMPVSVSVYPSTTATPESEPAKPDRPLSKGQA